MLLFWGLSVGLNLPKINNFIHFVSDSSMEPELLFHNDCL